MATIPPSSLPSYTYRPLPSDAGNEAIRLLKVASPDKQGTISCDIVQRPLQSSPRYIALSYCWGDNKTKQPIIVSDESGKYVMQITKSLHEALQQLSTLHLGDGHDLLVWADALCINQADLREREQQVSLMGSIYSKAFLTFVWLGASDEYSIRAFNLFEELLEAVKGGWPLEMITITDDAFEAVFRLLHRNWFRRVWIVQEVALAQKVLLQCGEQSMNWDIVNVLVIMLLKLGPTTPWSDVDSFAMINMAKTQIAKYRGDDVSKLPSIPGPEHGPRHPWRCTIVPTLQNFRSFASTDHRDKVFGMLGLVPEQELTALGMKPDYTAEADIIFSNLAISVLENVQNLDILDSAGIESARDKRTLRSWVPDWTTWNVPRSFSSTQYQGLWNGPPYRAGGGEYVRPEISHDRQLLGLVGIIVDTVSELGKIYDKLPEYRRPGEDLDAHIAQFPEDAEFKKKKAYSALEVFENWRQVAEVMTKAKYINGEPMLEVFFKLLTAGNMYPNEANLRTAFLGWFNKTQQMWWDMNGIGKTMSIADALGSPDDPVLRAFDPDMGGKIGGVDFQSMAGTMYQRRVFKTAQGYLGLGSHAMHIGDSIIVVKGGNMPLIGRRNPESGRFVLVSTTYVHGLMQGEALENDTGGIVWFE